jgi:hypothetical protein
MLFSEAKEQAAELGAGTVFLHGDDWEELVKDSESMLQFTDEAPREQGFAIRINNTLFREDKPIR